jgi:hypothetical protein
VQAADFTIIDSTQVPLTKTKKLGMNDDHAVSMIAGIIKSNAKRKSLGNQEAFQILYPAVYEKL